MPTSSNARNIQHGIPAREKLLAGAAKLARAVAVTYGPKGRTVVLGRVQGLLQTKDGVTVAREIDLEDPAENMGAQVLKEACLTVNDEAGDGTTTTAILAAAILQEAHKMVVGGFDPMQLAKGIQAGGEAACDFVRGMAVSIQKQEELERVALMASNGDEEIATLMAKACMAVGQDGTIAIEDGQGVECELVLKEGMEIERGALSNVFLGTSLVRELVKPLVAVVNATLTTLEDVQDLLEVASQWPDNPLLLFAETVEGHALVTMTLNDSQQVMQCVAVQAPGFGEKKAEYLKDIAAISGGTYIDPAMGFDHRKWDANWFGSVRKATVRQKKTLLEALPEAAAGIEKRISQVRVEEARSTSDYDKDRLRERRAKLSGGLALLKVGGVTEGALKERRARVEDALGSVRAALEGGVVPGGAVSYLAASESLGEGTNGSEGFTHGWAVLRKALRAPLYRLAANAGVDASAIIHRVVEARRDDEDLGWMGWCPLTNTIRDFGEEPLVLDPTYVAISAIRAACSVAATLLTAETSITRV